MEASETEMVVPRQERSVASTRQLIAAATDLFVERGYHATTLVAIGERAGFSRGIVTARFGNKEGVAWAVVQEASRRWSAVLSHQASSRTGLDDVVEFIRVSRDSMVTDPTSRLVLERLYSESAAPLAPLHDRFEGGLRDLEAQVASFLHRGVDDGSVRDDIDADRHAGLLIAQLRGIGYQWFLFPDRVDPVAFHGLLTDQVVTWLGAGGKPSRNSEPGRRDERYETVTEGTTKPRRRPAL